MTMYCLAAESIEEWTGIYIFGFDSVCIASYMILSARDQAAAEKPKAGPMPTGRRHKNVPVPFFFQPDTADTFATLEPVADDVFLASMPKGGTTWTHKIIHLLLHGLDDDGQPVPEAASSIGASPSGVWKSGNVFCTLTPPPDPHL